MAYNRPLHRFGKLPTQKLRVVGLLFLLEFGDSAGEFGEPLIAELAPPERHIAAEGAWKIHIGDGDVACVGGNLSWGCSSTGQSSGLITRALQVRVLPSLLLPPYRTPKCGDTPNERCLQEAAAPPGDCFLSTSGSPNGAGGALLAGTDAGFDCLVREMVPVHT